MNQVKRILILGSLASSLMLFGCTTSTPNATPSPSIAPSTSISQTIDDSTTLAIQSVDIEQLKQTNPDLATQLEGLKDLTPDQKKAKFEELKAKYPDDFKNMPQMKKGNFDHGKMPPQQMGRLPFGPPKISDELKAEYPTLEADLQALKGLTPDQMKTKMDELKTKYPDFFKNMPQPPQGQPPFGIPKISDALKAEYPNLEADLQALKDLTPDQMKTKMDELKTKYPDFFKNMPQMPPQMCRPPFDHGKMPFKMGGPPFDPTKISDELKTEYPNLEADLQALKGLTPDQRKTKFAELKTKYPDFFKDKHKK